MFAVKGRVEIFSLRTFAKLSMKRRKYNPTLTAIPRV
jgi:hypothetical protein